MWVFVLGFSVFCFFGFRIRSWLGYSDVIIYVGFVCGGFNLAKDRFCFLLSKRGGLRVYVGVGWLGFGSYCSGWVGGRARG